MNVAAPSTLLATNGGMLKMPAPMTIPTTMETASGMDSVRCGVDTAHFLKKPPV
jgi:hypothetical protein